jgi:peptidoglycan hydrolase CwlO-like protein
MPLVRRSGSRALVLGILVVLCSAITAALAPFAHAQQSTATSASDLRAQADELSNKYFAALDRVQSLDDELTRNQQLVDNDVAKAKQARAAARARALIAYTTSGTDLSTFVDGNDTLDAARRAKLIDRVNAHDEDVYAQLHRAMSELHKQQRTLRETRQAQADALDQLKAEGAAIDAKLAQAVADEQAQAAAAAAAQAAAAPSADSTTSTTSDTPTAAAPSTTTTTAPAPSAPTPPAYTGTPGTSPHHDDPFLTCVRLRESGGNYSAVNPAGPYLGAYQFLQATWNVTAAHAGRSDLVGVPANVASPYDQDEMAWALYQWQGMGPWGGSC